MFALTRSKKSLFYCHRTATETLSTFFFAVTFEVTGFQSHTPLYETCSYPPSRAGADEYHRRF